MYEGSGILNQPQVFSESGILGAMMLFLIASYFIWLGCVVVVDTGLKLNIMSYQGLIKHILGMFSLCSI